MEKMLEGVKVLDFCIAAAGPSVSRMLVDFGAEDIMVEPLAGQSTRTSAPHTFDFKTAGKKSIPLDLKSAQGKEVFLKLVQWADVLVTNFRLKALEKLGLTYEELSSVNPKLIYAVLTGFGSTGPQRDDPGYDMTAWWAKSGLMADAAQRGTLVRVPNGTGDFSAGQSLALGICAALYRRSITGKGTKVATSLMGSGVFLNYDAIVESQYGSKLPTTRREAIRPMLNTYQTGDGEWISVNGIHHWETSWPCTCRTIHREDLIEKYPSNESTMYENAPELIGILDEGFSKLTQDEAFKALKACGTISVEKVQHSIDVTRDPQAIDNKFVVPWTDRNGKTIMHPTTPVRFGDDEPAPLSYGPGLGEHTEEILAMLGYDSANIKTLEDEGVVTAMK